MTKKSGVNPSQLSVQDNAIVSQKERFALSISSAFLNKQAQLKGNWIPVKKYPEDSQEAIACNIAFTSFKATSITLEELLAHISKGYAFAPCTYKDKHKNQSSFLASQLLVIDFDNEGSEAKYSLTRLQEVPFIARYGLAMYASASSTITRPKTRLLFKLELPLNDNAVYIRYLRALDVMLKNEGLIADYGAMKVSQSYYGSKGCEQWINPNTPILPFAVLKPSYEALYQEDNAKIERLERFKSTYSGVDIDSQEDLIRTLLSIHSSSEAPNSEGWVNGVLCLAHNDTNPSAGIHIESGVMYCFACGAKLSPYKQAQILGIRTPSRTPRQLPTIQKKPNTAPSDANTSKQEGANTFTKAFMQSLEDMQKLLSFWDNPIPFAIYEAVGAIAKNDACLLYKLHIAKQEGAIAEVFNISELARTLNESRDTVRAFLNKYKGVFVQGDDSRGVQKGYTLSKDTYITWNFLYTPPTKNLLNLLKQAFNMKVFAIEVEPSSLVKVPKVLDMPIVDNVIAKAFNVDIYALELHREAQSTTKKTIERDYKKAIDSFERKLSLLNDIGAKAVPTIEGALGMKASEHRQALFTALVLEAGDSGIQASLKTIGAMLGVSSKQASIIIKQARTKKPNIKKQVMYTYAPLELKKGVSIKKVLATIARNKKAKPFAINLKHGAINITKFAIDSFKNEHALKASLERALEDYEGATLEVVLQEANLYSFDVSYIPEAIEAPTSTLDTLTPAPKPKAQKAPSKPSIKHNYEGAIADTSAIQGSAYTPQYIALTGASYIGATIEGDNVIDAYSLEVLGDVSQLPVLLHNAIEGDAYSSVGNSEAEAEDDNLIQSDATIEAPQYYVDKHLYIYEDDRRVLIHKIVPIDNQSDATSEAVQGSNNITIEDIESYLDIVQLMTKGY